MNLTATLFQRAYLLSVLLLFATVSTGCGGAQRSPSAGDPRASDTTFPVGDPSGAEVRSGAPAEDCKSFAHSLMIYVAVRSGLIDDSGDPEMAGVVREAEAVMDRMPDEARADLEVFVEDMRSIAGSMDVRDDPERALADPLFWDEAARAVDALDHAADGSPGDDLDRYIEQICT